ncbi:hypothetical protein SAMN05428967_3619 [Phyllobacterium sp. YR620]|nr:hypothetical protein SAMN05428967_3619 [Phyllobacterium sp. YR620]
MREAFLADAGQGFNGEFCIVLVDRARGQPEVTQY